MSQTKTTKNKVIKKAQKPSNLFKIMVITIPVLIILGASIALINNSISNNPTTSTSERVNSVSSSVKATTATSKNSDLTIQVSEISDKAKFYPVEVDGTKLEVLAVKAPDGTIRTAFNTCQVCYSSGKGYYKQEGNVLVCQNCGNRFKMNEVEVTKGGCNPVPINDKDKAVNDTTITISKEYLAKSKSIFANWKD